MKTISHRIMAPALLAGLFLFLVGGNAYFAVAQDADAPAVAADVGESSTATDASAPAETDKPAPKKPAPETASSKNAAPKAPDGAGGDSEDGAEGESTTGLTGGVLFLIIVALFIVPVLLGNYFAKQLKMPDHGWKISVALGSVLAAAVVLTFGQLRGGPDLVGGIILVYELEDATELRDTSASGAMQQSKEEEDGAKRKFDMSDMIAALMKRVNPGGNKEVTIRKYGLDQIEIIIPKAGADELERIKEELTTLGELEFRITVDRKHQEDVPIIRAAEALSPYEKEVEVDGRKAKWVAYNTEEESLDPEKPGSPIVVRVGKDHANQDVPEALIFLDNYNVNGTDHLVRSMVGSDGETAMPAVHFQFNTGGASRFGRLTGANLPDAATGTKRHLGILLNRQLERAPSINSKITDRGIITGYKNQQEVEKVVNILNAGSLPAALNPIPISEETISPTLGLETIEKGRIAITISLSGVLVFMLFYYRFSGIIACFALAANLVLIVGLMVLVKAAFTLPGLAGLVLTVGMSVDANVLIFERIREELGHGAALRMAIRNGFGRATRTIVDANLTTLITGVVLFWIGTDQIKGFAVTLILGIVMSMFTAIFCSRIIFDIAERRRWITALKMRQIVGTTKFDFLSKEAFAATVSVALITIGLIAAFSRGTGLFNIDFTGGASVTMVLKKEHAMEQGEIHQLLAETDLGQRNLSVVERGTDKTRYTINARFEEPPKGETKSDEATPVEQVQKIIQDTFGEKLETHAIELTPPKTINASASLHSGRELEAVVENSRNNESGAISDEDSIVIEYDPTGRTLTQVAYLQEDADAPVAESTATESESTGDMDDAPAAGSASQEEPAKDAVEADPAPEETPATDTDNDSDAAANESPAAVDKFAGGTETALTFGEPVAFDTVARWVDEMLKEHSDREIVYSLTNPAYAPGSSARYDKWALRLELPIEEATPVLNDFQVKLNAEPMFPLSNRIGGRVAEKMQQLATIAIVLSLICIIGYIWLRFQHVVFGLAAVVALVHDVLVTLGVIAISAYVVEFAGPIATVLRIEPFQISLTIVAAFMTIIGYSLNDTIVVFDRIREVRGKSPELTGAMINTSINQTLSRTLLTSLTTFIVVTILYFVGGSGIHGFAFALVVGVLVGTYSSIFIASPVLLWLSKPSKKATART